MNSADKGKAFRPRIPQLTWSIVLKTYKKQTIRLFCAFLKLSLPI